MSSARAGLRLAGFIFAVVCIAHIYRLVRDLPVTIGTYEVPAWPSVAGAVVAGIMCLWMWMLSTKQGG